MALVWVKSPLDKTNGHKFALDLHDFPSFIIAFFVFLSFNPFFLWGYEYSKNIKLFFDIFFCLFAFTCFLFFSVGRRFFLAFPLVLAWGGLRYSGVDDNFYIVEFLAWSFKTFFILALPSSLVFRSGIYFGRILAFFGFFSICGFVFIFFYGDVLGEYDLLNPYEGKALLGQEYVGFYFGSYLQYLVSCDSGYCVSRMNGALDEPGLWGTVCALYLSAHKLDIATWRNRLILISGLLTFSLAFYVLILVSAVFLNFRRGLYVIFIIGLMSLCFYVVSYDYFNSFIVDRISIDGFLFQRGAEPLLDHLKADGMYGLFFGSGYLSSLGIAPGASSWLVHLYEGGVVLIALMLLVYVVIYFLYKNNCTSIYYFPVIMFSFIQRPEIVWVGYLYLYLLSFQCGRSTSGSRNYASG